MTPYLSRKVMERDPILGTTCFGNEKTPEIRERLYRLPWAAALVSEEGGTQVRSASGAALVAGIHGGLEAAMAGQKIEPVRARSNPKAWLTSSSFITRRRHSLVSRMRRGRPIAAFWSVSGLSMVSIPWRVWRVRLFVENGVTVSAKRDVAPGKS